MSRAGAAVAVAGLVLAAVALTGCDDDELSGGASTTAPTTTEAPSTTAAATTTEPTPAADPALRDELLAMMEEDQAERTGQSTANGDAARTERLKAIIAVHGWPTFDLVGTDGATAAWVIAQHADGDPDFQDEVVALLRPLVAVEQASPGELAYLEDRVAVNRGLEQTYGTQIRCRDGAPAPATPIADEAHVDDRRDAAGLGPIEDYYAELADGCAAEG